MCQSRFVHLPFYSLDGTDISMGRDVPAKDCGGYIWCALSTYETILLTQTDFNSGMVGESHTHFYVRCNRSSVPLITFHVIRSLCWLVCVNL